VDIVGPSNLVTLVESFPPYWGPFLASTWYPFVGDPKDPKARADMEARSPLFKVDRIRAPLLIGQGRNDPRVTEKESEQIVAAMERKGLPVTYVVYSDEGHGFARPENRLDFFARSEAFLAGCLGGKAEPMAGDRVPGSTAEVKVVNPKGKAR
jgi:dipeptidyl aminopeptidase/acylaminoacyl peptidase